MRRAPSPPGPEGATLIELLVALSILALMAVLLLGGMRLGTRAWESADQRRGFLERLERTDAFLRQLVSQTRLAGAPAMPSPDRSRGFQGEPERLGLLALLPQQLGGGGRYAFGFSVDADRKTGGLVLGWRPLAPGHEAAPSAGRTLLLADVAALRIAYFGRITGRRQSGWYDAWSGQDGLPALIRLTLSMVAPARPGSVTLYFAPRLADEAG